MKLGSKWIHDSRTNTTIDETLGTELSKHLYAIESNLSRISYHQFMRQKLNLTKNLLQPMNVPIRTTSMVPNAYNPNLRWPEQLKIF